MADKPILYRKRLIPNECIRLDQDEVLFRSDQVLVTRWHTIRPKKDLDHGVSCFLLEKGWKISRFLTRENELICWYCDIMDYTYEAETDTYIFTDLLADVLLYPSGDIRVVDLDEIAEALEQPLHAASGRSAAGDLWRKAHTFTGKVLAPLNHALKSTKNLRKFSFSCIFENFWRLCILRRSHSDSTITPRKQKANYLKEKHHG